MTEAPDEKGSRPRQAGPISDLRTAPPGAGFDLLRGIRVLDLTSSIAGPYASMLLGDLGAEIIKVERPGRGDDARHWGPPFLDDESLWYLSVNRNKKSLTLDFSSPAGRTVLAELAAMSDIFIVNQPPRVQKKLGIDYDTVHAMRRDIIYVSITGFGLTGARADRTCYDLVAEGYSGVMDVTGEPDGPPQKIGAPAADLLAGQDAAMAAQAALVERARSGNGHLVDISLVESMTRFMSCRIVPFLGSGEPPKRSGGRDSVIAVYQAFETADEPITLGLGNDAIWARFWEAVEDPAFGAAPEFGTNAMRHAQRPAIIEKIAGLLKTRCREEWLELFARARVPAGPVNTIDELCDDDALRERQLFFNLVVDGRRIPQVGTGIHIDGEANVPRQAPPRLGEHGDEILRDLLGYSDRRLNALKNSGIT